MLNGDVFHQIMQYLEQQNLTCKTCIKNISGSQNLRSAPYIKNPGNKLIF